MNERLWARVNKAGPLPAQQPELGPCWLWSGATTDDGYGVIGVGSRTDGSRATAYVHRLAFEQLVGAVPAGLELDHLCRNRACVRPTHMEAVTHQENVDRGTSFSAVNARKVECARGHAYDDANTWVSSKGWRQCRACNREKQAERRRHNTNARLAGAASG